ncbi:MAG TPA: uroporphyrinogen decarboxylase family protein, partial [Methanomassiliicoccales archaeon]|nr:uroporphyrinogen decarboxylase family protein [Methanomassiliicoccales archaeon]
MKHGMTSMERTLTTLQHKEPDRVPLFLNLTMHGARLLGMPLMRYYSEPESMVKAQLAMRERYGNDCVNAFTHASAEFEAFGGSTQFYDDGPPNSGEPV